jgi:predicted DNA-binding protein with PD1-like motif
MEYLRNSHPHGDKISIRLNKGDNLFASLERLALKENLKAGHLSGIGAVTKVEMGYYELAEKKYYKKQFNDIYELLSLEGNLCYFDGKPFYHMHVVLSDHTYQCFGGHLFDATCAIAVELNFRVFEGEITRKLDPEIGLGTLQFCSIPNKSDFKS